MASTKKQKPSRKKPGTLVLVRHGESWFNTLNVFTGNIDVALTAQGLKEAHRVGRHCKGFTYDAVFTSHLERAQETLVVVLATQEKMGIFHHEIDFHKNTFINLSPSLQKRILPVYATSELNERSYGALQGMNKTTAIKKYGAKTVFSWRRSFDQRPPEGESLKDVYERVVGYFERHIHPHLNRGESVLVVAHGNTLRALIKFLENISDHEIPYLDLPFAKPIVYTIEQYRFLRKGTPYTLRRPLR